MEHTATRLNPARPGIGALVALEAMPSAALAVAYGLGLLLLWTGAGAGAIMLAGITILVIGSGFGWMLAGHVRIGVMVSLTRIAASALVLAWFFDALRIGLCEHACANEDPFLSAPIGIILAGFVAVSPIVSALLLHHALKHDGTAPSRP